MAYRHDKDLEFFKEISNEDFSDLVYCLTKDKNGGELLTEELTMSDGYKKHYPEHSKYWEDIAAEVQCFGANTFATLFRGGKGVLYKEVLQDVADKLKVNYSRSDSVIEIENNLLLKILGQALENMSEEERAEFAKNIGIKGVTSFTAQSVIIAIQALFKAGGFQSYQLTLIIANYISRALIGRGLTFAGNAALTRAASIITGPIGWAIMGVWTAIDIAGPAYRITIPAVVQVALLRTKNIAEKEGVLKDIEKELNG